MEDVNLLEEIVQLDVKEKDLILKVTEYRLNGRFTGVRRICRRLRDTPKVIKYAHFGQVFDTLEEAYANYKQIGSCMNVSKSRKPKMLEMIRSRRKTCK